MKTSLSLSFLSKVATLTRTSISWTTLFPLALTGQLCQLVKLSLHQWDEIQLPPKERSLASPVWLLMHSFPKRNCLAELLPFSSHVPLCNGEIISSPTHVGARICFKLYFFSYFIRFFFKDAAMTNTVAHQETQQASSPDRETDSACPERFPLWKTKTNKQKMLKDHWVLGMHTGSHVKPSTKSLVSHSVQTFPLILCEES